MSKSLALVYLLSLLAGCASTQAAAPVSQTSPESRMQTVPLKYASAPDLASELGKLQRRVRIVADPRTNSLILCAESEKDLAQALELIARLDVEAPKAR